jgi:hypothetical protein
MQTVFIVLNGFNPCELCTQGYIWAYLSAMETSSEPEIQVFHYGQPISRGPLPRLCYRYILVPTVLYITELLINVYSVQRTNTENSKQIFPEKELRCHSLNLYIHVSVNDLYIPTIDLPILLQENMWTDPGNI